MTKVKMYAGVAVLVVAGLMGLFLYFKGNAIVFAITQTDKVEAEQARFEQYLENYGKTQGLN